MVTSHQILKIYIGQTIDIVPSLKYVNSFLTLHNNNMIDIITMSYFICCILRRYFLYYSVDDHYCNLSFFIYPGTITDLQQHKQKYVFSSSEDGRICIFKEGKWEVCCIVSNLLPDTLNLKFMKCFLTKHNLYSYQ